MKDGDTLAVDVAVNDPGLAVLVREAGDAVLLVDFVLENVADADRVGVNEGVVLRDASCSCRGFCSVHSRRCTCRIFVPACASAHDSLSKFGKASAASSGATTAQATPFSTASIWLHTLPSMRMLSSKWPLASEYITCTKRRMTTEGDAWRALTNNFQEDSAGAVSEYTQAGSPGRVSSSQPRV